jgi:hypothetical protein
MEQGGGATDKESKQAIENAGWRLEEDFGLAGLSVGYFSFLLFRYATEPCLRRDEGVAKLGFAFL